MFRRTICALAAVTFLLCFVGAASAADEWGGGEIKLKKLSFTASRAIFTYSELYAFGKSEDLLDEGIFPKDSARVTAAVDTNLVRLLDGIFPRESDYPLNRTLARTYKESPLSDETFATLKTKYILNLRRVVNLDTRLKESDGSNPVVELTAAPVDFDEIDSAAAADEGLQELVAMLAQRRANGLTHADIKADKNFQSAACEKFGRFLENLTPGERKSIDVECEVVIGEDGNKYWVPKDREILAEFFSVYSESDSDAPTTPSPSTPTRPAIESSSVDVFADAYQPDDKWLIYWYVCGTDIESNRINPSDSRRPGDVTRCINELETANWTSPNVEIFMQAGGTEKWGHSKFKRNDGQVGRYVYNVSRRDWTPNEMFPINSNVPETLMNTQEGFEEFLRYGRDVIEAAPEIQSYKNAGKLHRVLIIVDHGNGSLDGVCSDAYGGGDMLNLIEMRSGFENVFGKSADNPAFELVGFDTCLMSTYEAAIALEGVARYMVASQESIWGPVMFEYTGLINGLAANPAMSGANLGRVICDTYVQDCARTDMEFRGQLNSMQDYTMSVVALDRIGKVKAAYEEFGREGIQKANENPYFFTALSPGTTVERYAGESYNFICMVDLKDFAEKKQSLFPATAQNLINAIDGENGKDGAVVYQRRGDKFKNGGGLSTYYPYISDRIMKRFAAYYNLAQAGIAPVPQTNLYIGMLRNLSESQATAMKERESANTQNTDELLNISGLEIANFDLGYIGTEIDKQAGTITVELDESQLLRISNAYCGLCMIVRTGDSNNKRISLLSLGFGSDIDADLENRTVTSNFYSEWTALNGHFVFTQIIKDAVAINNDGKSVGYIVYVIPIKLNGELCNMLVSCSYPDKTYEIIGIRKSSNNTNGFNNEFVEMNVGDTVTTIFPVFSARVKDADKEDFNAADNVQFMELQTFTLEEMPEVEDMPLGDAHYAYYFAFTNPIGAACNSEAAIFSLKNGKMIVTSGETDTAEELWEHLESIDNGTYVDDEE